MSINTDAISGSSLPSPRYRAFHRLASERWGGSDLAVGFVVAFRLGNKDHCWPSVETVAKDAGVSVRTAGDCLHRLVEGDVGRGLLPMFTRERRGNGFCYRFVVNPDALVAGRNGYERQVQAFRSALSGSRAKSKMDVDLSQEMEDHASEFRQRKAYLDRQLLLGHVSEEDHQRQCKTLNREIDRLAHQLAQQHRQILPRKHVAKT